MRKLFLMLAFLGFFGLQSVLAQTNVSGNVTDSDGNPIPGATVIVKELSGVGTVTDIDGNYNLQVPDGGKTLVFTFVGMQSKELAITGGVINASLANEDVGLGEVVVTALGITRDAKALGYSATSVNSESFEKNSSIDAMNSLQGRVAGVQVSSGGGMPGSSTKVIIRGYSSVSGNNNPLYVIDGVPIDNSSRGDANGSAASNFDGLDFGNRSNDINPNDIESMTILKGAAATAQYGPRGANGVVMITTKKGKNQSGLTVEFNSSASVSDILRVPQMQNMFGQGWSGHWAVDENGSWGPQMDGTIRAWGNTIDGVQKIKPFSPVENNLYEFYDFGQLFQNSLSISGGDEKNTFYMSFGNVTADGVIPTDVDNNQKNTVRFNATRNGKIITASANVSYVRRDGKLNVDGAGGSNSAANLYSELMQIPRDFSIVDFEDYKNDVFNTPDYYFTPYAFNPYYALNENQASFFENRVYGNLSMNAKITEWANFTYRIGVDASSLNRKSWEAIMRWTPGSVQDEKNVTESPGAVFEEAVTATEISQDFLLNLNKSFGDISLTGMLGYTTYTREYKLLGGSVNSLVIPYFYNVNNTDGTKSTNTTIVDKRMYAFFGEANLGYKSFAYLTVTGRNDYSSTLPKENPSFFYPSVSASFIANEAITALKGKVDLLKIRASWGQAGNDADPYLLYPVFVSSSVWVPFSSLTPSLFGVGAFEKSNRIGNLNLTPEITTEQEVGIDLRLFKSRLAIDLAYYNRISDGQILAVTTPSSSGYSSQVINFGEVQNKGIELLATVVPVRTNDFEWALTASFTKNHNEILSLPDESEIVLNSAYDVEMVAIEGRPVGVLRAPDFLTDDEGHIIVNASNGIPLATTENTEIGTIQPDYTLGIINDLKYKNFNLSFTLDYRPGGYMYSGTADLHYFVGNATQTMYNERQPFLVPNSVIANPLYGQEGQPEYIENTVPIAMTNINAYYYTSANTVANRNRVIERDYLKLRDVSLSYTLPSQISDRLRVSDIQVVFSGRNLLMWTPESNNFIDPESSSYGNDLASEFGEFRTGPTLRSFTASLRVKF